MSSSFPLDEALDRKSQAHPRESTFGMISRARVVLKRGMAGIASRAPMGLLRRVPALAAARSIFAAAAAKRPVHDAVPSRGMAYIKGAKRNSTEAKVSTPPWRRAHDHCSVMLGVRGASACG